MLAAAPVVAVSERCLTRGEVDVYGEWQGGWCWTKLSPLLRTGFAVTEDGTLHG